MNDIALLEMNNITKYFPGVVALDNMQLKVRPKTVHALMGENGAGKSTLMKILIGLYKKDAGEILFDGKPLNTSSVSTVLHQGISMIYQELNPLENMTVAENIFCGKERTIGKTILVDKKKMNAETKELLNRLEIDIHETLIVGELSAAQKQLLEIAKAVSYNSKLIIMDEPTSAISEKECQALFRIICRLKDAGMSFIYITHKMDEVFNIADEITVMRDGKYIATKPISDTNHNELVKLMVGREINDVYPKEPVKPGETVLEVNGLNLRGKIHDVSFSVRKGEIFGVAGLMGAMRTEIMETIFGIRKADSGEIKLKGKSVVIRKPSDAIKLGMSFLTEDRKKSGSFLPLTLYYNVMMITWKLKRGMVDDKTCRRQCAREIEKYDIKTTGIGQVMNNLSGGNQQKALLARWLRAEPEIIVLDEPTRGIDVATKHEIYKEMTRLAKDGRTIIMISSEMPELLGMSDRIMVIHNGSVAGVLNRDEADQETVLRYAAGLSNVAAEGVN